VAAVTKALVCARCFDIRGLHPDGFWVACHCGRVEARWLDPDAGTVRVRGDRTAARILGLNNRFLVPAAKGPTHEEMVEAGGQWEWWRALHVKATGAPGYIFDAAKRSCWACIMKVGETNDVTWEERSAT
jgi:hypothetical protein